MADLFEKAEVDFLKIHSRLTKEEEADITAAITNVIRETSMKLYETIQAAKTQSDDYKRMLANRSYPADQMFQALHFMRAAFEPGHHTPKILAMFAELKECGIDNPGIDDVVDLSEFAVAEGWRMPKQLKYWVKDLGMKMRKRTVWTPGYEFRDKNRWYRILPTKDGTIIQASLHKSIWHSWTTCVAAQTDMVYTEKAFKAAICELRTAATAKDGEQAVFREGPPELHKWMADIGMLGEDWDGSHYHQWRGRNWRLNCLGQFQAGYPNEHFDRWANSVDHTFTEEQLWNRELWEKEVSRITEYPRDIYRS